MRKLYVFFSFLIVHVSFLPAIPNDCNFYTENIQLADKNFKKLIHNEMLRVPNSTDSKEKLKKIWYAGGYRNKIQRIISQRRTLERQDLINLKSLISQEKNLVADKIKEITDFVNQNMHNKYHEALKFKKSEHDIEDMFKEVEISADNLIKKEYKTYDSIIDKIDHKINNIDATTKGILA